MSSVIDQVCYATRKFDEPWTLENYLAIGGYVAWRKIVQGKTPPGEIIDEVDVPEELIVRIDRNEILVSGATDLREINHFFNTTFPLLEHRSLNGYLLEILGQVPEPGEKIRREGVVIEVTEATDTQVLRARISRQTPSVVD